MPTLGGNGALRIAGHLIVTISWSPWQKVLSRRRNLNDGAAARNYATSIAAIDLG